MRTLGGTIARVTSSREAMVWLWPSLVFPSSFIVHKYLGWEGTVTYAIVVALVLAMRPTLPGGWSNRRISWFALATFIGLSAVFLVVYPIANIHAPGRGSDDDDSLNLGATALLTGHSPYAQTSYLGNVLHHLPGAFVLAAPFVLVGTSAAQNLFWLPLFFFAVREEAGSSRTALQLAWLVLALSPAVVHDVVTGTSYTSNTIYVLLGLWWLVRTTHRDLAAIAWGVALASRANFLLLVPLAFGWLGQHHGWRVAARAMTLTCLVTACLTLPFYVHDPVNFTPLDAANRLLRFDELFPHLGIVIMVLMSALSIALACTPMDTGAIFRNCALVQAFPVVTGVVLSTLQERQLNLWYARYGAFFAWFALMALATGASLNRDQALRGQLVDEREEVGL
jgi:hypothetical protein